MTRLTIAAAALAAGLTTFAPFALSDAYHSPDSRTFPEMTGDSAESREVDPQTTGSIAAVKGGAAAKAEPAVARRSPYDGIIAKHAARHGVPVALAHAVVTIESNYRANARGRAGEVGLMQIKPATARGMGYSGSAKALYDPETNIRYGMKYLAGAHKLGGGDVCGTILRYNAGHGAKRMNSVSAAYCSRVKRQMASS